MNGFVNVQIRVLAAQAQRALNSMRAQLAGLSGSFATANRSAGGFARAVNGMGLSALGSRIQTVGRQLQYNFTLPILAAAGASAKLALDNEAAFTRVTKVYGDAAHGASFYSRELTALKGAFEELSNAFGVNQAATIEIAAQWAAAGVSGVALAKSVELTMKTMVLGEMNATDATQALISIQAQYGQSIGELTDTIATLNMIENQTGISLQGLIQGFSRAAGVARGAGVDVRQLGAMLAALTPAAGSAAQAGNALKTIFSRLMDPTEETVQVLDLMGISVTSLRWKSANMVEQLKIMSDAFQGLSDKQKGVVSSVVASRWQVNKFEILMRELSSSTGYYQRALDATSDKQAVFTTMTNELNAVLNSSPQRLKIIWTMLQNGAADIIQPMIPLLLYLAQAIQNLVKWFSNLNPAVQKLVIVFLLLLAVTGPMIRIFGALVLLFAQVQRIVYLLITPFGMLAQAMWTVLSVPIAAFFVRLSAVVRFVIPIIVSASTAIVNGFLFMLGGLSAIIVVLMRNLAVSIAAGMRGVQIALLAGARVAGLAWRSTMSALVAFTSGGLRAIQILWVRFIGFLQAVMIGGARALGAIWRGLIIGMAVLQTTASRVLLVGWGRIWAGMAFLTFAWTLRIRAIMTAFLPWLRNFMLAVYDTLTGPWGIAITAVVLLIIAFWDDLKKLWQIIIDSTIAAWNALPKGIRNAMLAVVNIVNAAARQVYKAFSWMNPWARHSPSLVENVTSGMAEIARQFSAAEEITRILSEAGLDLESFGAAVKKVKREADLREIADERKDLASIASDALPEFDKLAKVLFPLKDLLESLAPEIQKQQTVVDGWKEKLDAANDALDTQEKILDGLKDTANNYQDQLQQAQQDLDRFASAPIEGMKAMSDAIFANEMQQKQLRLEMMKMEDAIGPLDQLQGKINAINGDLEVVSGQQKELRQAGAGSDILKFYDDQIDALNQQHDAILEQIKPIQDLSDQIDELGRKAEELDLENSLQFDPLKRQIDDLVNSMKEMPFEEILAGVTENKKKVDDLTVAYDQASEAVKRQEEVVAQLTAQRDAIQAAYDLESKKLDQLKDQYDQVNEKVQAIEQALKDAAQAAKQLSDAGGGNLSPGAQNFLDAAGGNFPDVGGSGMLGREGGLDDQAKMVEDFTKELAAKTKNMFGLFNFLEPIKKAWNVSIKWMHDNILPAFSAFGSVFAAEWKGTLGKGASNPFSTFVQGLGKWFQILKDIFNDIIGSFGAVWRLIGPDIVQAGVTVWNELKKSWQEIQPEIKKFQGLIGPLGKDLKNLWTILKPILGLLLVLILGIIKVLLHAFVNVLGPAIRGITDVIVGVIKIIRGIAEFVSGVFAGEWSTAWQGIVDIFSGIWDVIWGILKGAVTSIWGLIKGLVEGVVDFFVWLWDELVGHSIIPDIVNAIMGWWNKLADFTKGIFNAIASGIRWAWDNLIKPVFDGWGYILNWLKGIVGNVFDWMRAQWDNLVGKLGWAWGQIQNAINGIKNIFNDLWNGWSYIVNLVVNYINYMVSVFNGIRNRFSFSGMFDGIKSAFQSAMNWVIGKWNNLSFSVGGVSIGTPNIPFLARGGLVADQAMAIVGEGRAGYPEYVIPTDPQYRKRALNLFQQLGKSLGLPNVVDKIALANNLGAIVSRGGGQLQMLARGGILGSTKRGWRGASVVIAPQSTTRVIHFHGDLSFPNIDGPGDVEEFIRNLEALAGA